MKNTDIIIVAPESLDYPLFRKFLHDIKNDFNKIIYVFTKDSSSFNYSSFIEKDLKFVNFIYSENKPNCDWRNTATNIGLDVSTGEKVLFLEPDFRIDVNTLVNLQSNNDVISYYDNAFRIWPSFLIVKSQLIKKTKRDFSAGWFEKITKLDNKNFKIPMIKQKITQNNILVDHFGKFVSDLLELTDDFYFLNETNVDFYHYAGLTHNFNLCRTDNIKYLYNPSIFLNYLKECLNCDINCDINCDDQFNNECIKYIELINNYFK